jgi:predicted transcriptional regulator
MVKSLEQKMFKYFTQLNDAEKKSVILLLKTFLMGRAVKPFESIDIEQYNKEIDEAIARVESGEFYNQKEVEKLSKEL